MLMSLKRKGRFPLVGLYFYTCISLLSTPFVKYCHFSAISKLKRDPSWLSFWNEGLVTRKSWVRASLNPLSGFFEGGRLDTTEPQPIYLWMPGKKTCEPLL